MAYEPIEPLEGVTSVKRKSSQPLPETIESLPMIQWMLLPERFLTLIYESNSKVVESIHRNFQKMQEESSEAERMLEVRHRHLAVHMHVIEMRHRTIEVA